MKAAVVKVWLFLSGSTPGKKYQTIKRADGSLSCDCPGWTKRVARDGSRTCKHTRLVMLGHADSEAESYSATDASEPATSKPAPVANAPRGGRVFDFSE